MAYANFSTANYIRGSFGAAAVPKTIAAWVRLPTIAALHTVVDLHNSGAALDRNSFKLEISASGLIRAVAADGSAATPASSATTMVANTWHHACAVFTSATSRAAYLDGGNKGTNTTSRTPSSINQITLGCENGSSKGNPFGGWLYGVSIWDAALTDADVASLAGGASPLQIRPDVLTHHFPMLGVVAANLGNVVAPGGLLTVTGSVSTNSESYKQASSRGAQKA